MKNILLISLSILLLFPFFAMAQFAPSWDDDGKITFARGNDLFLSDYVGEQVTIGQEETFVPEELIAAKGIEQITLDDPSFSDWEAAMLTISQITTLKELRLENCRLEEFPSNMSQLNQIEELMIKNCDFLDFEQVFLQISKMKNLQAIYLDDNATLTLGVAALAEVKQIHKISLGGKVNVPFVLDILSKMPNIKAMNFVNIEESCCFLEYDFSTLQQVESLGLYGVNHSGEIFKQSKYLSTLKTLSITLGRLGTLPTDFGDLCPNLEQLLLINNSLSRLPASISKLQKLKEIDLSVNNFREIPVELYELKNLEEVSFFLNKNLETTDESVAAIQQLPKLKGIYLGEQSKLEHQLGVLRNIRTLKELYLEIPADSDFSKLSQIPKEIEEINLNVSTQADLTAMLAYLSPYSKIKKIAIRCTDMTELELPNSIGDFEALEVLQIHGLYGTSVKLPANIGKLQQLQSLLIEGVSGLILPKEIGRLQKLEIVMIDLYRQDEGKVKIDNALFDCKGLQFLKINNKYDRFPAEIGQLVNLKVLDLGFSSLKELPTEIGNLKQLEVLNLALNNLRELPASIGNLTKLKYLNLDNNLLDEITPTIGSLKNLSVLNMNINSIKDTVAPMPKTMEALQDLRVLKLSVETKFDWAAAIKSMSKLPKLAIVDLRMGDHLMLPATIGALTQVRNLRLEGRTIRGADKQYAVALPNSLAELSRLESLVLEWENVFLMPADMSKMKALCYLSVLSEGIEFEDYLGTNTKRLATLPKLEILRLRGLEIKDTKIKVVKYPSLESLYLEGTQLSKINDLIACYPNLKSLSIEDGAIKKIPCSIQSLSKLKALDISETWIKELPICMKSMNNLQYIRVNDNNRVNQNSIDKLIDKKVGARLEVEKY